jgi:hypothetical protein
MRRRDRLVEQEDQECDGPHHHESLPAQDHEHREPEIVPCELLQTRDPLITARQERQDGDERHADDPGPCPRSIGAQRSRREQRDERLHEIEHQARRREHGGVRGGTRERRRDGVQNAVDEQLHEDLDDRPRLQESGERSHGRQRRRLRLGAARSHRPGGAHRLDIGRRASRR